MPWEGEIEMRKQLLDGYRSHNYRFSITLNWTLKTERLWLNLNSFQFQPPLELVMSLVATLNSYATTITICTPRQRLYMFDHINTKQGCKEGTVNFLLLETSPMPAKTTIIYSITKPWQDLGNTTRFAEWVIVFFPRLLHGKFQLIPALQPLLDFLDYAFLFSNNTYISLFKCLAYVYTGITIIFCVLLTRKVFKHFFNPYGILIDWYPLSKGKQDIF